MIYANANTVAVMDISSANVARNQQTLSATSNIGRRQDSEMARRDRSTRKGGDTRTKTPRRQLP